jgi:hypothetical protein
MGETRAHRPLVEFAQFDFSFHCVSRALYNERSQAVNGARANDDKNAGSVSDIFTNLSIVICVMRTGAENHAESRFFLLNTLLQRPMLKQTLFLLPLENENRSDLKFACFVFPSN